MLYFHFNIPCIYCQDKPLWKIFQWNLLIETWQTYTYKNIYIDSFIKNLLFMNQRWNIWEVKLKIFSCKIMNLFAWNWVCLLQKNNSIPLNTDINWKMLDSDLLTKGKNYASGVCFNDIDFVLISFYVYFLRRQQALRTEK